MLSVLLSTYYFSKNTQVFTASCRWNISSKSTEVICISSNMSVTGDILLHLYLFYLCMYLFVYQGQCTLIDTAASHIMIHTQYNRKHCRNIELHINTSGISGGFGIQTLTVLNACTWVFIHPPHVSGLLFVERSIHQPFSRVHRQRI